MKKIAIYISASCFFFTLCGDTYAQGVPQDLLQQTLPGRIEERFEDSTLPRSSTEEFFPVPPGAESPDESLEDLKFTLKAVQIEGVTAYSEEDLQHIFNKKIGQSISASEAFKIADSITTLYRNDGYILSQAILPPQTIEDGILNIVVIEGFINDILIEGIEDLNQERILSYAKNIKGVKPLDIKDLERFILLSNDLPGITARLLLKPSSSVQGAADIVLITDHDKYSGYLSADNRGSRFVGPLQASMIGTIRNTPFVSYDQLQFSHITASQRPELSLYNISYSAPVDSYGGSAEFNVTRSFVEPGFSLEEFDIKSRSTSFSADYSFPVIRSREENLFIRAGFHYRDSETTLLQAPQSEDRVRYVTISGSYDFVDSSQGISQITLGVSQGLNILNATESGSALLSREDGRSDFTRFNMSALHLRRIADRINLSLSIRGQLSLSQQLSSQEFGYGGNKYGRAYDPSEITGDHGIAGVAELSYVLDESSEDFIKNKQLYTFYDIGAVWRIDPDDDPDGKRQSGASLGVGFRGNILDNISTGVEVALPLTRPVSARTQNGSGKGNDPRIMFSVARSF